jgi:hypothetical protein
MVTQVRTPYDREHDRELAKVDHDRIPALPLFLQTPVPTAYTIAALCQGIPISDAAALIEQYARSEAAAARLEEAQHIYDRLDRCMEKT